MNWICPKCGTKNSGKECTDCYFDNSMNYELYPALVRLDDDILKHFYKMDSPTKPSQPSVLKWKIVIPVLCCSVLTVIGLFVYRFAVNPSPDDVSSNYRTQTSLMTESFEAQNTETPTPSTTDQIGEKNSGNMYSEINPAGSSTASTDSEIVTLEDTAIAQIKTIPYLSDIYHPERIELSGFVGKSYYKLFDELDGFYVYAASDETIMIRDAGENVTITATGDLQDAIVTSIMLGKDDDTYCLNGICSPLGTSDAKFILWDDGYEEAESSGGSGWRVFTNDQENTCLCYEAEFANINGVLYGLQDYLPFQSNITNPLSETAAETQFITTSDQSHMRTVYDLPEEYHPDRFDLGDFIGKNYQELLACTEDLQVLSVSEDEIKIGNDNVSITASGDGTIVRMRLENDDTFYCIAGICPIMGTTAAWRSLNSDGYVEVGRTEADDEWIVNEIEDTGILVAFHPYDSSIDRVYGWLDGYAPFSWKSFL